MASPTKKNEIHEGDIVYHNRWPVLLQKEGQLWRGFYIGVLPEHWPPFTVKPKHVKTFKGVHIGDALEKNSLSLWMENWLRNSTETKRILKERGQEWGSDCFRARQPPSGVVRNFQPMSERQPAPKRQRPTDVNREDDEALTEVPPPKKVKMAGMNKEQNEESPGVGVKIINFVKAGWDKIAFWK